MDDELTAELTAWCAEVAAALELQGVSVDTDALLGVAGVAAHAVRRPAAPLTTYLIGVVAGRAAAEGRPVAEEVAAAVATVRRLAAARETGPGEGGSASV
jgi:hypothetical protein